MVTRERDQASRTAHSISRSDPPEARALWLAALCYFCVLASYYIVRPIREQFASAAGGSQALPLLQLLVLAAMLALTPRYGALVSRYPRRVFVPVVYAFFVLCLLGMGPLLA